MASAPDIFMQEHQAKSDFVRAIADLRSCFRSSSSTQFLDAWDATTEAALRFGGCELRMRRADRLAALNLSAAEAKHLGGAALSNNERGLEALTGIRPFIDELRRTEPNDEALSLWRKSSADLRAEWRDHVGQLNVSADNALHIVRMMDECCAAMDKNGAAGLGEHLSATLDELDRQRRAPNRGTQEASFPFWKFVLAAVILGMYLWSLYDLITRGAPWWDFYIMALVTSIMMLFVVMGC